MILKLVYMTFHLTFLFAILFASGLYAQSYCYEQFIKGNKVGELTVERKERNNELEIQVYSAVEFNFKLAEISVEFDAHAHYKNGQLIRSSAKFMKNGDVQDACHTSLKSGAYIAKINDERCTLPWTELNFSSLLLYFKKPESLDSIYAEAYGQKNAVFRESEDSFRMIVSHNGNQNMYHYKDDLLVHAHLEHWISDIDIRLEGCQE